MHDFLTAATSLGTGTYWAALMLAIVIGIGIGFVPGMGATLITAIMVIFVVTTVKSPAIGIVMLAMVSSLDKTLDTIPAVLAGVPSSETQVAYMEGHQLARRGRGAYTMGAIYGVSVIGGLIGAICLAIVIPIVTPFILQFSYGEIAAMALFGVAMVALLARGAMLKGLASGMFGILLGTIGVDPLTGIPRFTFGNNQLWTGLPLIAFILGVFALPELIDLTLTRRAVSPPTASVSQRDIFSGFWYGFRRWKMALRQSLLGVFLGAIPGLGGAVIDWLAYALGIGLTRDKRKLKEFGKGSLDGVLFAEAAQHSKAGGQALPTLALGIPASRSWAVIMAAIIAYGIAPGPSLLENHGDIPMLMVITLGIGNIIVAGIGLFTTRWLVKISKVEYPAIAFTVIAVVFLGSFMDMGSGLALPLVALFGLGGLMMKRFGWPRPPLVLGFILGPVIDQNLQSAVDVYGLGGLFERPIVIILLVILAASVIIFPRLMPKSVGMTGDPDGEMVPEAVVGDASDNGTPDYSGPGVSSAGKPAPIDVVPGPSGSASQGTLTAVSDAHRPDDEMVTLALDTIEEDASPQRPSRWQVARIQLLKTENWFALAVIACAAAFVVGSLQYPFRARILPEVMGLGIIAITLVQLIRQVLRGSKEDVSQIMDLGLISKGIEGARRTGFILFAILCAFALATAIVGLEYSSIGMAVVGPLVLLSGRIRWISAVISGLVVAAFAILLMQDFAAVVWPSTPLGWLVGR